MPVPCEVGEVLTHLPTRREASQVVRLSRESPTSPLASLRWRTAFSWLSLSRRRPCVLPRLAPKARLDLTQTKARGVAVRAPAKRPRGRHRRQDRRRRGALRGPGARLALAMPRKVAQQPVQQPETDEQGQQKVCYLDNFLESAPACPTLG